MHICIIIDRLDFGGAERVAITLAHSLLRSGHNITIVTIDPIVNIDVDKDINLHTLNFEKKWNKYMYNRKKMYRLLDSIEKEEGTFDLILVHLYLSSRIMKKYQHPACYHIVHSTQSKSALKNKVGFARLKAKFKIQQVYNKLNLICVSHGVQNDLLNTMNIKPSSTQVIYNPFDIKEISLKALEKVHIPATPYIIFVGRLVKEKRIDYLLHAYAKSNITQKLLILGDGEELKNLKLLTQTLNLMDKVDFHSAVKNPYPFIAHADFLILSSLYEGLPTVLIEALILQTPILSTNCPSGPKEIMKFYTMDALVDDNFNINALSSKINEWAKVREPVKKDAMNTFDTEYISKIYLDLIK